MLRENARVLAVLRLFFDMLCVGLSFLLAWHIRFEMNIFTKEAHLPLSDYASVLYTGMVIFACLQYFSSMYESRRMGTAEREVFQCLKNSAITLLLFLAGLFFFKKADYSRLFVIIFTVMLFFTTSVQRITVKFILKFFRRLGYNIKNLVVVGNGPATEDFIKAINLNKDMGYKVFAVFEDCRNLGEFLLEHEIDEVIISLDESKIKETPDIINICEYCGVKSSIIPYYIKYAPSTPKTDRIEDIILINTRYIPLDNIFNNFVKRIFDIVVSMVSLIILSPVFLTVSILIKKQSDGPVFFKQERVGFNGKTFNIYKFRSMKTGTKTDAWTVKDDDRVSEIGKFLRRHNIDELPQLINIFLGQMSLVGPRPEQVHFVDKFKDEIPKYMLKHRVRPGLTGWAQVNGLRGDTSISERIKYDLFYIENWTFMFDIKIILMTLFKGNKNAY